MRIHFISNLKKAQRLLSVFLILMILLVSLSSKGTFAFVSTETLSESDTKSSDIVILYENDVHCAVDGYSKLAAMKKELIKENEFVGVVSMGDFVQGDTLGAISKGEYISNIMNLVGYDAIALGNHEFDYKLQRLFEICGFLDTKPICSNFYKTSEEKTVFEPYVIKSYGEIDIAYIGITTPDTLTSSSPIQFMDKNGKYIYSFCADNLYTAVQNAVDSALCAGADYIVGLAHLGTENVYDQWSTPTLIKNTTGFDVILDGHSHSIVENMTIEDKAGNEVIVSSTGTKFENIGKLTISKNNISTQLIPTESYTKTDSDVDEYITQIKEEYSNLGNRIIAKSEVDLIFADENGNRLIRHTQTNLGDFCADAFRVVTGADIGVINGGGIRSHISKGDVTFNNILSVFPFNNTVCVAEVTGRQILDFLELSVSSYPDENGSFQHVSGLTYTLNSYIPSPVKFDDNMAFESVDGVRRVSDVKILNSKTGKYEAIDASKTYTLASHNYLLMEHGSGATMFDNAKIVSNSGMLDVELLEVYVNEHLDGVIGKEYESSQNRVQIVTKEQTDIQPTAPKEETDNTEKSPLTGSYRIYTYPYVLIATTILAGACLIFIHTKKQKNKLQQKSGDTIV